MNKKEKLFSYILFFFGLVLFVFSFSVLIYLIVRCFQIDWKSLGDLYKATRNYLIVEFITVLFKIVVSCYAIMCRRHLDDAINPLFTFTCLYIISVILQTILFFTEGGLDLGPAVSTMALVDLIVSTIFFGGTLFLKCEDWFTVSE